MWLGTWQQLANLTVSQLEISASILDIGVRATDLGVLLDSQLSMALHIAAVCRMPDYQMRQLWSIKRSLTTTALQALVQAFVYCRLDYCNALLAGVADVHLKRLQSVQNAAARLVSGSRRCDPITPVLARLHWLLVRQRIAFKTVALVSKAQHGAAPQHLWLTTAGVLMVPRAQTTTGQRSFAVNGPTAWNSLLAALRAPDRSLAGFKHHLKTY